MTRTTLLAGFLASAIVALVGADAASAVPFEVWAASRNDPANGGSGRVYSFNEAGNQLSAFNMPAGREGGLLQLAPNGDVYTWDWEGTFLTRHTATGGQVDVSDGPSHDFASQPAAGGLHMSANGQFLYAASFSSGAVHIFNTATKAQVGLVVAPSGAAIDVQLSADETALYLVSYSTNRVWRYTGSGATWIQDLTFDGDGELAVPATVEGIAVDGNGNIYTTAYGGGAVYKYDAVTQTTSLLLSTSTDFGLQPIGVEIGPDNKLYIGTFSGAGTNKLLRYNLNGTKDATLPTPGVFASGLDFPITVDFKLIPEPASLTLLALGGFALLRRRVNPSR